MSAGGALLAALGSEADPGDLDLTRLAHVARRTAALMLDATVRGDEATYGDVYGHAFSDETPQIIAAANDLGLAPEALAHSFLIGALARVAAEVVGAGHPRRVLRRLVAEPE